VRTFLDDFHDSALCHLFELAGHGVVDEWAGEIVLFDRSCYNRAGVERAMGFCDEDDVEEFFHSVPEFERMLVRSGIQVITYWSAITDEEQHLHFLGRMHDPLKLWKLSPMAPNFLLSLCTSTAISVVTPSWQTPRHGGCA
jgi:hypothetical protein